MSIYLVNYQCIIHFQSQCYVEVVLQSTVHDPYSELQLLIVWPPRYQSGDYDFLVVHVFSPQTTLTCHILRSIDTYLFTYLPIGFPVVVELLTNPGK